MAEVTAFKAVCKLKKDEINQVKTMFTQYKVTGIEGTGTVKLNLATSFFAKLMEDNIKRATDGRNDCG